MMCICDIFYGIYFYSRESGMPRKSGRKNCEISEAVGNGVLTHMVFLLLQPKRKDVTMVGKTHETCCYLLNAPLLC